MSENNSTQQDPAVGEPLVASASQAAAAVQSLEADAVVSDAPSTASTADNSPLGAFRRARLNPAVDDSQVKPVPSLPPQSADAARSLAETQTPASPAETAPGASSSPPESPMPQPQAAPAAVQPAPVAEPPRPARSSAPIEIPPPVRELDAALEAEIEAAMASGELEAADAAVPAALEEEAAEAERPPEELLEPGHHFTGKIQSIHADNVFLDLGYRSPGVVALRQFSSGKKPEVGQLIEVLVDRIAHDEGLIYLNLPKGLRRIAGNWESLSKGQIVDCLVNRTNKGGLEVTVSGLRAFLPSSQVELGFVSDLEPYVGQKLRVEVIEVNRKKRNLVVSRRAFLQIERQEAEGKFWETLDIGQTYTGRVKTVKDYGAFVDLGSVDGFLHIGEMSWHRIKHPSEVVKEGQTIDIKVLSLDREKKKISLGMKQLAQNPWTTAPEKYPANSTVSGKVTRIADFGAFVELEPGLEGLIHVSELDHRHVRHASDVVKVHQVVTAQVLEVDVERKRISLSLKALMARPEEPKPAEEPPPEPQRRKKGPLKGGTGSSAPTGLFGNPSDYR